jgi:hypothetical protein
LFIAQYSPEMFWRSVPLDELESWVKGHLPEEMAPDVARGMETARFKLSEKGTLVQAADRYVAVLDPRLSSPAEAAPTPSIEPEASRLRQVQNGH